MNVKMSAVSLWGMALCVMLWPLVSQAQTPPPTKEDYRKIFSEALGKYFSGLPANNLCMPPLYWANGADSIELNERLLDQLKIPTSLPSQLKALENAGLVSSTESTRTLNDKTEVFRKYTRTEKGNKYFSENRFCFAHADYDRIVKWRGPAIFGEYQIAIVYYTTKTSSIADWAKDPGLQSAFPTVAATLLPQDPSQKPRQVIIDLTSEGWEVNEWSKYLQ